MLYLQEHALKKVIAGSTAIKEMVKVLSKSDKSIKKLNKQHKKQTDFL